MRRSLPLSAGVHALLIALVLVATRRHAAGPAAAPPAALPVSLVWLAEPGPGGGGGGGGNQMKAPARRAELPGRDARTVPAASPARPTPSPQQAPDRPAQPSIPALTMAAAPDSLPGAIEAPPDAPTLSQGSGIGGGAGTGRGSGIGAGTGSGLGDGTGGGTGGGVYRPGNGVTSPRALYAAKPRYTNDAMRARLQGAVLVECIVQTNGACADVRVLRSLDAVMGLDQEAIKAALAWRFAPGTLLGQAVPVYVTIELDFVLR
jgi:TonB family protein